MPERKRKGFRRGVIALLCLLIVCVYAVLVCLQPFANLRPTNEYKGRSISGQDVSLAWPSYGEAAIGAIGYGVLDTNGSQTPLPTASIAKIVTALAVLRVRPLNLGEDGPAITLTQDDIDSYNKYVSQDGSVVKVALGEQISEYQALEALLLPSANNMAETLARWAFGSIDSYNEYANQYATELGLSSIKITDPSGFLPSTVASAHDLTVLGEQAMLNPVLAQIVDLPSANIPVQGSITNYNFLVGDDANVGIKTGNSDQDLGAYLFAFKETVGVGSVTIIGSVMGGPDLATVLRDAKTLADSAAQHFQQINFVQAGDVIGQYGTEHDRTVQAVASQSLTLIVWEGYAFDSSAHLQTVHGSAKTGSVVGNVRIVNTSNHITNTVPVVLKQPLSAPGWLTRLKQPI